MRLRDPGCLAGRFLASLAFAGTCLVLVTLLNAPAVLHADSCVGPEPLEAQIHAHPTADAYVNLGNWFSENHKSECAIDAFRSGIKLEPTSPRVLDGLARLLIATGDYEGAINLLKAAPRDERLILDLGTAYDKAGQTEEAVRVLEKGVKSYPDSDRLTGSLASIYIHDAQYETAAKVGAELARRKPQDIEAQRIYLHSLAVAGNNDLAAPLAQKLLALKPHDPDFLQMNGYLEFKGGDYPTARKHLEEAIALNPKDANARANLGFVLVQTKDAAEAEEQLKKAIELGAAEPQVRFELAKVLRSLGKSEEAQQQLEIYQKQIKDSSDRYEAMFKTAEAAQALKSGDKAKAAELYRAASALQPNDPSLAYRLAQVLAETGDIQGERAALEQAVKADPGYIVAQYQLGYLDFQAGDDASAERRFRLTVAALPNEVQPWCSLASTLGRQSKFQEAQDAVDHALKLEPNNAVALKLKEMLAGAIGQH